MLGNNFRPWGEINWLLTRCEQINWNIIGGISFEDRCLGLASRIDQRSIQNNLYYNILPPDSQVSDSQREKLTENLNLLIGFGVTTDEIVEVRLKENIDSFLAPLDEFIIGTNGNIIVDISTLPKRFFFPIIKRLIQSDGLENLIITYSKPEIYTPGDLSWDPSDWSHIPLFMADDFTEKPDLAIISVGFVPLGLPKLLIGPFSEASVRLIFPHPPGAPNYQRNWEFVRRISETYPRLSVNEMLRVHALNLSDAFDKICDLTNKGGNKSILAPYGPKPISIAMALFAIQQGVPVYYTQPNYYAADYSSGLKETYAYWIVNSGDNLYTVS